MYDATIHLGTIARQFQKADFVDDPDLLDDAYRLRFIERAVSIGQVGFKALTLTKSLLRGKTVYQLSDLAELLVLRHLTSNIRRVTGVRQDNRPFIVDCIRSLMREGTPFRVYKYDIKEFYESVVISDIISHLHDDVAFSGQAVRTLASFFEQLENNGVSGLPRGLALSATLAEYLMRSFDYKLSRYKCVQYFSRFVDDIIIVTNFETPANKIHEAASNALPSGLSFNSKSKSMVYKPFEKKNTSVDEGDFEFLGYRFAVSQAHRLDQSIARTVRVDMAASKVRRIKTRLIHAVLQYRRDNNFTDLLSRCRLLTGNFRMIDRKAGSYRLSGIYFSYPLIDIDGSESMKELDEFIRKLVSSPHSRNALRPNLSRSQQIELMRLTFRSGFKNKRFYHFRPKRLAELRACWAYA
ncbi:MAG: phage-related reverse [Hyphomicrobiales bacterium]|nr:phage-related reverse [Hyphomicrobiales bacterium]